MKWLVASILLAAGLFVGGMQVGAKYSKLHVSSSDGGFCSRDGKKWWRARPNNDGSTSCYAVDEP